MTDEWTRAEKRKAQSEQAKAIMDFVSMLSDKINELEKENAELKARLNAINLLTPELEKSSKLKKQQLTKAVKLLKWALHSDPEHDDLADFDTKWKEAEQFIKDLEK